MQIETPVIIAEGLDIFVHRSIHEAEASVEAIDVDHGIFRAWDARGHSLTLTSDPPHGVTTSRNVHIELLRPFVDDHAALVELLSHVLTRHAHIQLSPDEGLASLLQRFIAWQGHTQ